MTLFRPHQEADALAYAAAGGQALHLVALTPARLYDRDCDRLVRTVHALGETTVRVARTCTPHQHVVVRGMTLIRAGLQARTIPAVSLLDICHGMEATLRCEACALPIPLGKLHVSTGTGYQCAACHRDLNPSFYQRRAS